MGGSDRSCSCTTSDYSKASSRAFSLSIELGHWLWALGFDPTVPSRRHPKDPKDRDMGNNHSTTSLDDVYLAYGDGDSIYSDSEDQYVPPPPPPQPRRVVMRISRINTLRRPLSIASDITAPLTPSNERYPYPFLPEQQAVSPKSERPPTPPHFTPPASPQILHLPPPQLVIPAPSPPPQLRQPTPTPLLVSPPSPRCVPQPPSPVSSLTDTLCEPMEPLVLTPPAPSTPPTRPRLEQKPAAFMELTSLPSAPWYYPEQKSTHSPVFETPSVRPVSPPILVTEGRKRMSLSSSPKKVSFSESKPDPVAIVASMEDDDEHDGEFGTVTFTVPEPEKVEEVKVEKEEEKKEEKVVEPVISTPVPETTEAPIELTTPLPPSPPTTATTMPMEATESSDDVAVEEIPTPSTVTSSIPEQAGEATPTATPSEEVLETPISRPLSPSPSLISPGSPPLEPITEVDEPIMHLPISPRMMPSRSPTPVHQISFSPFVLPPLTRSATFAPAASASSARTSFDAPTSSAAPPPLLRRSQTAAPTSSPTATLADFRASLPQPKPKPQQLKGFSIKQVSRHSTINDLWIVIGDEVFDCTEFAATHPGGAKSEFLSPPYLPNTLILSLSPRAHS